MGLMPNSDRKGITSYLAGGLGNQLFMAAAAWEQSRRLNCPLYLNTSYLNRSGGNFSEIKKLDLPAQTSSNPHAWGSARMPNGRILPFPKIRAFSQKIFFEKDDSIYDPRIDSTKPNTTFIGYFQSEKYFPNVAKDLFTRIEDFELSKPEATYISLLSQEPAVTLHLRRGDYLVPGSVIASVAYANRALRLLRLLGNKDPVRVFTDSPKLAMQELRAFEEPFSIVDNGVLKSSLGTIKAMSLGSSFVLSNSSLSWWGAWMSKQRNTASGYVFVPRPWNKTGSARSDMLLSEWLTVDARG
jgi:hypothetical protein